METTVLKRMFSLAVAGMLICATSFGLAACSASDQGNPAPSSEQPKAEQQTTIKVTVAVDSSAAENVVTEERSVEVAEDATVLDALEASGISYSASSGQYGTYVTNIGGLAEKDHGSASGWMFLVNGEYATEAVDACTLADGDTVTWEYFAGDAAPDGDAN